MYRFAYWALTFATIFALACQPPSESGSRDPLSFTHHVVDSHSDNSSEVASEISSGTSVPPGFKLISYDDAYRGFLIRSMPLTLAFPENYEPFENEPNFGKWLWTTRSSYDVLQSTLSAPYDEGLFLSYISTTIGYDRDQDSFVCGPGCGETEILSSMRRAGQTDVAAKRYRVNDIPIWIVEATMPRTDQSPSLRLRFAYLGTMIETNVVMISYRPPEQSPDQGDSVWAVFLSALLRNQD